MAEYTIINIGANKRLNVKGDNVVTLNNHHDLTLWEKSGTDEQRWIIDNIGNGVYIKSIIDTSFGLNAYRLGNDNWECDLLRISGNETDAAVNLVVVGGRYRIQLTNYPEYYLTASGSENGSSLYWTKLISGSAYQTWALYEVPALTPHTIENMPDIPNQTYPAYGSVINNAGCCACCCCNVASYYGNTNYNIIDLGNSPYYAYNTSTAEAYFANYPNVSFSNYYPVNTTQTYRKLRAEISEDRPVLIRIDKQVSSGYNTHWVVAYGFTGTEDSADKILVLDPYNSITSSSTGKRYTLQDAFNVQNCPTSITRLMPTSSKA